MQLPPGGDTIQELTVEELRAKVGTGMDNRECRGASSPQHGAAASQHTWRITATAGIGWRKHVVNMAPDIGFLHTGVEKNDGGQNLHQSAGDDRPPGLPLADVQQPGLYPGGGKVAGGGSDAARPGDSGDFDGDWRGSAAIWCGWAPMP
jgi:hypothetical protein